MDRIYWQPHHGNAPGTQTRAASPISSAIPHTASSASTHLQYGVRSAPITQATIGRIYNV